MRHYRVERMCMSMAENLVSSLSLSTFLAEQSISALFLSLSLSLVHTVAHVYAYANDVTLALMESACAMQSNAHPKRGTPV